VRHYKVNIADGVMYRCGNSIDLSIARGRQKRPLYVDSSSVGRRPTVYS